jgi:hypothetical protein
MNLAPEATQNQSLDQTADEIQRSSRADGPPLISFTVIRR